MRVMEKMRGITSVSLEVGNLTEVELMENVRNNHTVPPDVMSLMQPGTHKYVPCGLTLELKHKEHTYVAGTMLMLWLPYIRKDISSA